MTVSVLQTNSRHLQNFHELKVTDKRHKFFEAISKKMQPEAKSFVPLALQDNLKLKKLPAKADKNQHSQTLFQLRRIIEELKKQLVFQIFEQSGKPKNFSRNYKINDKTQTSFK